MNALPLQMTHCPPIFLHATKRMSGLSPASITDTALAELTPTGGAWFFPTPSTASEAYSPAKLASALQVTLNAYPQLCALLSLTPPPGSESYPAHTRRYGRVWVQWGPDEPGLLLTQARWDGPMTDVLPRAHSSSCTGSDAAPSSVVMPNILALVRLRASALRPAEPGPSTAAQITTFSCGGVAIALAAQHALLDAHALAHVLRDWGSVHAAMVRNQLPQQPITRTYAPMALDAHAKKADGGERDQELEALSQTVPQLRLDFWAYDPTNPDDAAPGWFTRSRYPAPEVDGEDDVQGRPRGARAPFETWDPEAPVGDAVLDLSAQDVDRIWRKCGEGEKGARVSRLDAVLGTVWRAIVTARTELELELDLEAKVYLHSCVGLRTRLDPLLPDDFQGAPVINVSAGMSVRELLAPQETGYANVESKTNQERESENGTARAARSIRAAITTVTPTTASAVLHHMAHALDPAREWNVFVGSRNILSTSWLGIGAYDVDLGFGRAVRVHPFMPPVDSIVVVMEASGVRESGALRGVSLRILLREDVLARVLADPELVGQEV